MGHLPRFYVGIKEGIWQSTHRTSTRRWPRRTRSIFKAALWEMKTNAEFRCALTWAPHSAPCCIHKATGETPPNKDITWYQIRYAACLTTIYFLHYSCFLKILINYTSICSTGSEQMFCTLPLPIQPSALCLRASCHLSSHHPAVGNSCWEGAEALGGRAGGAPGAVIIRFNHRTLIGAKQHRAAWSIHCPCPKYLE